jgi:hypothetical protein
LKYVLSDFNYLSTSNDKNNPVVNQTKMFKSCCNSVQYEYGTLIRAFAVRIVGGGRDLADYYLGDLGSDFHAVEGSVSDVAARLFATEEMYRPVSRDHLFLITDPELKVL